MPMERLGAWALLALLTGIAVFRSATADGGTRPNRLSAEERRAVGRAAAALEPKWRLDSIHHFPADCWSQDDDYGASEWTWVRDEANRRGVPISDVFQAIDEDLRAYPVEPPRKATACPCKPRPFTG